MNKKENSKKDETKNDTQSKTKEHKVWYDLNGILLQAFEAVFDKKISSEVNQHRA